MNVKEKINALEEKMIMFKFKINNTEWSIEKVDEATINNEMKADGTLGVTIYKTQKIMLLKDQAKIGRASCRERV